jgi:hypothetical protein
MSAFRLGEYYGEMADRVQEPESVERKLRNVYSKYWRKVDVNNESGRTARQLATVPIFDVSEERIMAGVDVPYSAAYAAWRRQNNKGELLPLPPAMAREIAGILFDHTTGNES